MLGVQAMDADLNRLDPRDQALHADLDGRDPDEGMTQIAYEKGALFLRHLEEAVGRDAFDDFLRGYFDHFAFQSITTADFESYLAEHLGVDAVPVSEWIYEPGLPVSAPRPASDVFDRLEGQASRWIGGEIAATDLDTVEWTTFEWLHFLGVLPEEVSLERLGELDRAYELTESGNAEIAHQWLLIAIRNSYRPADSRLERYLVEIGRRKLILPLYAALAETPAGLSRARAIYDRARPGYHPISSDSIDAVLDVDR